MSRVGISPYPPKELRSIKSIGIESTNPEFDKAKLADSFFRGGYWEDLSDEIRRKTSRFFRLSSLETVKNSSSFVRLHFEIYKGSVPDYQVILDTIQEYLPQHGVRIVECELEVIDDLKDGN